MFKTALLGCAALLWAGSAQAATFVEYTFSAHFTGWWYEAYPTPSGPPSLSPIEGEAAFTLIVNPDNPNNFDPMLFDGFPISQGLSIQDAALRASWTLHDPTMRNQVDYSLALNYIPGLMDDGLPQSLSISDILGGSISFHRYTHYEGQEGEGAVYAIASREVDATGYNSIDFSYSFWSIAAVPEPVTWLMMIAGFGLIGAAMRRQRRIRLSVTFTR